MSQPSYAVGIDLGTTNTVVAYTEIPPTKGQKAEIAVFPIPQIVSPGVVEQREMLPSFIFLPSTSDAGEGDLNLPWKAESKYAVGEWAKIRGAEVPDRLISSAKSWLCNPLVDRNDPILPWKGPEALAKLSPVAASAMILDHIREAWNQRFATVDPDHALEHQDIYLTVPASFDAVARDLTVKAAEAAGLSNVTLLEEPQAAFYAWIHNAGEEWRQLVHSGDLVLVCDIGGGTSDFSLIRIAEKNGELALERIAVGDHLLVGGDNMDLALAYTVHQKIARAEKSVDAWQMRALSYSCRNAKERLLSETDVLTVPISVLGRGSSLIGGTLRTELSKEEANRVILEGFFLPCNFSAVPAGQRRAGLQEVGLPYEADPAITRHLSQFLRQPRGDGDPSTLPTAVLYNGGVMKAEALRRHVTEIIKNWGGGTPEAPVREIPSSNFDLSVAIGAAYYGLVNRGQGIRIRGGLGQTYYIGIAAAMPAVPGLPPPLKALCVAPFGMEEGTQAELAGLEFMLVVGEPVTFELFASSKRLEDVVGTVVEGWESDEITPLTSVETTLEGKAGETVTVTILIKVTEIGTLEFWCVSKAGDQKWKLQFNVREKNDFES